MPFLRLPIFSVLKPHFAKDAWSASLRDPLRDPAQTSPFPPLLRNLFLVRPEKLTARMVLLAVLFAGIFAGLCARLIELQFRQEETGSIGKMVNQSISTARPHIVDRHGMMMAGDIRMVSIFANPREVSDKDEAAELLNAVFPELDGAELRDKLGKKTKFVWIKREVTPKQQADVHRLGIPGIGFLPENKRVYPNGNVAAHVLGFANIDNIGIAGIEKYIDGIGLMDLKGAGFAQNAHDLKPVELALDVRVSHAMREELQVAMAKFKAIAAAGLVLDVDTGEIIAHVSLPDYDPNNPADALKPDNVNRMQVGVYEMGSTFKALTTAMALDSGKVKLTSTFDARQPLQFGRFKIGDYHGKNRVLSVPEIFVYSSNIGTARMALTVGVEGHQAFLKKLGQLERMRTELPESAEPIKPSRWGELNTATISFGHGLAVAPLQAAVATAALVNGGRLIQPTYLKRSRAQSLAASTQVIKPETSEAMRYVMRLNAERGTATKANIPGFFVGGKTGTSEKVIGGRYSKDRLLTTFMAIMPSDKPRYLLLTILDEPKGLPETHGYATSGWNAAPVTGRIIERVGPMLDLDPRFETPLNPFPAVSRLGLIPLR